MRRFFIDTEIASDDAVALVVTLNYPDVRVEAIYNRSSCTKCTELMI